MPDMLMRPARDESRSPEQLYEHYLVERSLAERLRTADRRERAGLYSVVYNELFARVPAHPQLTRVKSAQSVAAIVRSKMALLSKFLSPATTFLEVGAGDCRLAVEVSRHVRAAYAVDVSEEVSKDLRRPENFRFLLSDGTSIPVPPGTIDVAYSYQLMEHIHPDDAAAQLQNIYKALAPGGVYICITPSRLTGPHDISRYFENHASGFHLREYTVTELAGIFKDSGFQTAYAFAGSRGRFLRVPIPVVSCLEWLLNLLPPRMCRAVAGLPLISNLVLAAVVGVKQ